MGYDKFVSFLSKNLTNKCYDDIYPLRNIEGSVISKYIYFDINFIIYKCINIVEDNVNDLIKVLNCIEKNSNEKIKKYIKNCKLTRYINLNFINKLKTVNERIEFL